MYQHRATRTIQIKITNIDLLLRKIIKSNIDFSHGILGMLFYALKIVLSIY